MGPTQPLLSFGRASFSLSLVSSPLFFRERLSSSAGVVGIHDRKPKEITKMLMDFNLVLVEVMFIQSCGTLKFYWTAPCGHINIMDLC